MRKFTQHEDYPWIESSSEYVSGLRQIAEIVIIPNNHVGYAEDAVSVSNYRTIEDDSDLIGRLNLVTSGAIFGNVWVAVIDDYTDEQFEELNDFIEKLTNYPLLDESLWSEIDQEMALEALSYLRDDDHDDVSDELVMAAIHELGFEVYHEGEGNYHIDESDLSQAVEYAAKQQELAAV